MTKCIVCDKDPMSFSWTDTHGIAQCTRCGVAYRIYHYEGEEGHEKRVEKPPLPMVKEEYAPVLRAYREQVGHMIPGGFSFPGGQELASRSDSEEFSGWMEKHAEEFLVAT